MLLNLLHLPFLPTEVWKKSVYGRQVFAGRQTEACRLKHGGMSLLMIILLLEACTQKSSRIIIETLGTDISGNHTLYFGNTVHQIVHHTSPQGAGCVFE